MKHSRVQLSSLLSFAFNKTTPVENLNLGRYVITSTNHFSFLQKPFASPMRPFLMVIASCNAKRSWATSIRMKLLPTCFHSKDNRQ
jgi:hypothetical protein